MRGIAMKYYTVYREDTEEIIAFGNLYFQNSLWIEKTI